MMEWLAAEAVDHLRLTSEDAERRVRAMEEKVGGSKGRLRGSSRGSAHVGRITEREEEGSEEAKVSSVIHLLQAGRERDIDLLVVDVDGLDAMETTRYHRLFDLATARGVSLILLSEVASSVALPPTAAIDAVLQKPLRKDVSRHTYSTPHSPPLSLSLFCALSAHSLLLLVTTGCRRSAPSWCRWCVVVRPGCTRRRWHAARMATRRWWSGYDRSEGRPVVGGTHCSR